ncbi:MAG: S-layer homology domain-containing protein [Candidatus Margulisbacteria bacterium]|nr:S-layer homology domain-containing protein [Candidatus Margulisiibacteriota bacterium]
MIKRLLIITILCFSANLPVLAVSGTSFDPSTSIYSARELGMGGVSIAFSDDANGVFNNPAGLTGIKFPQLSGSSRRIILDETQYSLLSWAMPSDWGIFGFGFSGVNTGGSLATQRDPATNRIIIDPSREAVSYSNSVMLFSYAKETKLGFLPNNISFGGSLKLFNQSLNGGVASQATATGIDLNTSYKWNSWLTLGANLQNMVEGSLNWENGESDTIGGYYKLGGKINLLGASNEALYTHQHKLDLGLDIDLPHNTLGGNRYHLGAEYSPLEKIYLRGGFNMAQDSTGLTLGVGVINGGFKFDYAFAQNPAIPGDNPHYFTISYVGERVIKIDKKLVKKEADITFVSPKDRFITDQSSIKMIVDAKVVKAMDQETRWVVTGLSETKEVKPIVETEALDSVFFNGKEIKVSGQTELSSALAKGRNVFKVSGQAGTDTATGELKVLRFDPFDDTPMNYWTIEPIALNVTLGIIKGYPGNIFQPERPITRAELVTLLVRSLSVDLDAFTSEVSFADVPKDHWAAKYITYAEATNLVAGYPDGTFQPNKSLTRAEGVTVLARYAKLAKNPGAKQVFPDLKADHWANEFVSPAYEAGLLKYLEGKEFKPSSPFSRAEACEVLYRTPQIQAKVDDFWNTGVVK